MFHSFNDFNKYFNKFKKDLCRLKNNGFIEKLGVSLHTNEEFEKVLEFDNIDLIQIPYNLLDNSNKRNDLSSIIQKASLQTRGVISFGIPIDIKNAFIQAPSLALILDNPALKKPLWEKIQKTFIK